MIRWLDTTDGPAAFPDPRTALAEPPGLLVAGGDLSVETLLTAYSNGIFPWYEEGQPILWWCPDPRAVLFPDELKISRSLRRSVRRGEFHASCDQAFSDVVEGCTRRDQGDGTWITNDMSRAYRRLHLLGHAHSIEVWQQDKLVGGLYGIAIGRVFFGESMFSSVSNASKVALVHLVYILKSRGISLIDCQIPSAHLASLGSREISRERFLSDLDTLVATDTAPASWRSDACEIRLPPTK